MSRRNKNRDMREKPMQGALKNIKCRRFMELLCCCCREDCVDFSVWDRYPCQRALHIVFLVIWLLLTILLILFYTKMSLYLITLPSDG